MGMSEMLAGDHCLVPLRNWAVYHPKTITNGLDNLTVMSDRVFSMSQNAMRRPEKRFGLVVTRILGRKAYSLPPEDETSISNAIAHHITDGALQYYNLGEPYPWSQIRSMIPFS